MDLKDILVTPIFLILIYGVAYLVRPMVTDDVTRVYFFPAITVKLLSALAVGIIYQFYYQGGDTYMYHTHGSRHVWEAMTEAPMTGIKLLFSDNVDQRGVYKYASQIYFFRDPASYAIVRIASIFDLFTFSTYSSTALLFAVFSFIGTWMFFLTFYDQYPHLHRSLAICSFFIPSVFFWGSGLLKDTITLGCLGMATYQIYRIFILWKPSVKGGLILILAFAGLYIIKIYILLTFLPTVTLWIFLSNFQAIRVTVVKIIVFPFVITAAVVFGYYGMMKATEDNEKYSINKLAKTAQVTSYDIRYWSGRNAGSGYDLGPLDGTITGMISKAPQAINVALFRPYLWEVNNPLMLLSALESFVVLAFCIYILIACNFRIFRALTDSNISFAVMFSLTFAFAVGVSTFNFGSLVRYKIPMLPFFFVALVLILDHRKRDRNVDVLDSTE